MTFEQAKKKIERRQLKALRLEYGTNLSISNHYEISYGWVFTIADDKPQRNFMAGGVFIVDKEYGFIYPIGYPYEEKIKKFGELRKSFFMRIIWRITYFLGWDK